MQNKYVGDVGDFANNGLLRWLTGMREEAAADGLGLLTLGVVWYLNHDENAGGNAIDYLNLQGCDEDLYVALEGLRQPGNRNIWALQNSGLLPEDTTYCGRCRSVFETRPEWLNRALICIGKSELILLGPDKGYRLEEFQDNRDSPQHTYLSDVEEFYRNGKSVVIYHHIGQGLERGQEANDSLNAIRNQLQDRLDPARIWVLRWHRKIARAYFVIAQNEEHAQIIGNRIHILLNHPDSPWVPPAQAGFATPHFSLVP